MANKTDWELVLEYYACHNEPMGELTHVRHYPTLVAAAYRVLRSSHEAEEVVQELAYKLCTLLCPLRRLKFKTKPDNVGGALRMRAKRLATDFYRRKKNKYDNAPPTEIDANDELDRNYLRQRFNNTRLIDCLLRKLQEAGWEIEASYLDLILDGKKLAEIALILGIDKDEARKRRQNAMRQAKRLLLNRQCQHDEDITSWNPKT